jgi:hypothetical protein
MQAVTLGLSPDLSDAWRGMSGTPPPPDPYPAPGAGMLDPAQLQHLMQLLGNRPPAPSSQTPPGAIHKQTAVVECPKSMVGRVIGKGGETIKALQQYTGAMIQIDQSTDPTRVTIAGSPQSLQLAVSMVHDIVRGTFKGFAMLRQIAIATSAQAMGQYAQPQPVYVQGYGFVPPSQVFNPEESMSASLLRTSPTGPLTPPMTPLRAGPGDAGSTDQLAALLGAQGPPPPPLPPPPPQQHFGAGSTNAQGEHAARCVEMKPRTAACCACSATRGSQPCAHNHICCTCTPLPRTDALIAQLLSQLSMQGGAAPPAPPPAQEQRHGVSGMDQGAIQTLLAQAGLMGAGQAAAAANTAPGMAQMLPPSSAPNLPPSTSLMLSAQGTPAVLSSSAGGGARGAFGALSASNPPSAPLSTGAPSPPPGATTGGFPAAQVAPLGGFLGTSPTGISSDGGSPTPFLGLRLASAANASALSSRRTPSGESSPLGRFGAIGSTIGGGGAAEDSLVSRLGDMAAAERNGNSQRAGSREGSPLRPQG